MSSIKKIITSFVLSISMGAGFSIIVPETSLAATQQEELNSIVAIVNEEVITQLQLEQQVNSAMINIKEQVAAKNMRMPPLADIRRQILQEMILTRLELQRAADMHIDVSTIELNNQIESIAREQNISVAMLYKKAQDNGLNRETYRQEMKDQMIIHKLVERVVVPKISVSDKEVVLYRSSQAAKATENKEYDVKNILIANKNSEPTTKELQQAEKQAKSLLDKINSGKISFEQAAFSNSTGEHSLQGGDLGWRKAAELPAVFVKEVINMQPGQVAGPIKAGNGFHLIKLVAVRDTDKVLTDNEIKDLLFRRKLNDALSLWEQSMSSSAYVKVLS